MQLKVWTPMFDFDREMRSFFDRFPRVFGEMPTFEFRPTIDVIRENGSLVVTTELPGVDPDKDVEIMVEEGVLIIKGEKAADKEVADKDLYIKERHFGSFLRRIPLPEGVDPDSLVASFDKGILKIQIPLPVEKEAQLHHIPIKVG